MHAPIRDPTRELKAGSWPGAGRELTRSWPGAGQELAASWPGAGRELTGRWLGAWHLAGNWRGAGWRELAGAGRELADGIWRSWLAGAGRELAGSWPGAGRELADSWPAVGRELAGDWPRAGWQELAGIWLTGSGWRSWLAGAGRELAGSWPGAGRELADSWPAVGRELAGDWPRAGWELGGNWPAAAPAQLITKAAPLTELMRQPLCVLKAIILMFGIAPGRGPRKFVTEVLRASEFAFAGLRAYLSSIVCISCVLISPDSAPWSNAGTLCVAGSTTNQNKTKQKKTKKNQKK